MKKIYVFLLFLFIIPLTGCSLFLSGDSIFSIKKEADIKRVEIAENIIEGFIKRNNEKIDSVLCDYSKNISDINDQIEKGFSFIKGNILTYNISKWNNGENYSKDNGRITDYNYYQNIYKILTDTNNEYEISINIYHINEDERKIGVTNIIIIDSEVEDSYFRIGYQWSTNYYFDTNCKASELIMALSNKDLQKVKELFSIETNTNKKFDEDVNIVMNNFIGKPIFGYIYEDEDDTYYDGNYDIKIKDLHDDVVIEDYEEKSVYIECTIYNILTCDDNEYSILMKAYLKNDDLNKQGIMEIIFINGDNEYKICQ